MLKRVLPIIWAIGFVLSPSKLGSDSYAEETITQIQPQTTVTQTVDLEVGDLSLESPFKVDSNWTSDASDLSGAVWQVGDSLIKFAIKDGKFVSNNEADTWFVYGWFGPLQAIKEPQNIKYPQWDDRHNGIDFAGKTGLEVVSSTAGKVIFAGGRYGNTVQIALGDYIITYGHLLNITVKVGDLVQAGDLIGHLGKSGTTNPHLHFEVDKILGDGKKLAINPVSLLDINWNNVIIPNASANRFYGEGSQNPSGQPDFIW